MAAPSKKGKKDVGYSGDAAASKHQLKEQDRLELSAEGPMNPDTKDFCGVFASLSVDNSWDLAVFKKGFSITINTMSEELVEFDMIGIDPPLANAFRRILIAEVPTVAIGTVTIYQNTGVIHDENIAHRLGLVPIIMDPDLLEWKSTEGDYDERNSVKFNLHVTCGDKQGDRQSVYSRDLKWVPWSEEQKLRFGDNPPRPVSDDILIAKLASRQELECESFCEKGIGKEHAKWSPVCTAYYKLLPSIELTRPIVGEEAEALKACCPVGVFDIEDSPGGGKQATVAHPRKCTTCRQCIELDGFDGRPKGLVLGKAKNHYIFTIESVGQLRADELFEKALVKLKDKCETAKSVLADKAP